MAEAPLAPAASSRTVAPPVKAGLPPGAAVAMMVASGFAGLGYQIVWTQQSAQWLGHEAAAVLAVVAAFFGGLALGALALGGRVQRSRQPAHWYAACEGVIALWSLALALWLSPISAWMLSLIGAQPSPLWQWLVAFFGTFLVLLPATAAMGATLPAMERVLAQVDGSPNRFGTLYASNTLGAVIGVLASAFWLVPSIGLLRTAVVCAALNLLCAGIFLFLAARVKAIPASSLGNVSQSTSTAATTPKHVLWMLATTGLLGIGYEVLVVRVISQVTQNTVYTFAILLAVYLVGTAAGAALYQRWRDRSFAAVRAIDAMGARGAGPSADASKPVATDEVLRDQLLLALAVACLLGTGSLWFAEDLHGAVLRGLGPGMASSLAAEAALALAAFALPTMLMGALFSHLCLLARGAGAAAASAGDGPNRPIGSSFGLSLGVNTLGAALAAPVFGAWLAPAMGAKWSLLLVAGAYLALVLPRAWFKTRANVGLRVKLGGVLALGLALAIWAPPLVFIDVPPGAQVVSYQEGVMAAVSVVQDAQGVSRLRINNRQQEGSSASQLADARQALLPLLLHPEPKRALFLGLGTGVTARAAAQDASLQVDVAELLPEVIAAARHFAPEPSPGDNRARERLNILPADARRFVRASNARYDVIISDNFHPARSGSGALYTVEHFQAVRARLAEGGLFCQWLPLHQLDLASLQSIVKSFLAVYPDGAAMLTTYSLETPVLGLVGHAHRANSSGVGPFDLQRLRERLDRQQLSPRLVDFGITDELALLGGFIASHQSLERFAANAPLNTDDHPVVAYLAPRATYAPEALPRDRLLTLLGELNVGDMKVTPADLVKVTAAQDGAWPQRLTAYWQARDLFIEAGRNVQPSADVRQMLAQVQAPLLAVLRVSPDFRPAYDPLLRMAMALARQDKPAAVALLSQLQQLQPARPEATQALEALDALR